MRGHNRTVALKAGVERVMHLDDEIAELKQQITDLKKDRKVSMDAMRADGHPSKVVEEIIREIRMDASERQQFQATLQAYRAIFNLLGDTPLGDYARRLYEEKQEPSDTRVEDERQEAFPDVPDAAKQPEPPTAQEIEAARKEGAGAAREGKKVFDNPYPASDARRAAWDCGWCGESGGDGMEIPEHLKPKSKRPKKGGDADSNHDREAA